MAFNSVKSRWDDYPSFSMFVMSLDKRSISRVVLYRGYDKCMLLDMCDVILSNVCHVIVIFRWNV